MRLSLEEGIPKRVEKAACLTKLRLCDGTSGACPLPKRRTICQGGASRCSLRSLIVSNRLKCHHSSTAKAPGGHVSNRKESVRRKRARSVPVS